MWILQSENEKIIFLKKKKKKKGGGNVTGYSRIKVIGCAKAQITGVIT